MAGPRRRGFWASLLTLSPVLIGVPCVTIWKHYALPEPVQELFHASTSSVQISERAILADVKHLTEDIGFRTVGTREHALGDRWMHEKALNLKKMCEKAVKSEVGRKLECEVWRQVGSGNHRFDILQTRLYKSYVNLSNIILRISDGTPRSKEHAILVNAHLDSTLPSPGAADDALAVAVMVELARNLILTKGWEPHWSIIFLFNNAEESLQDGSHLFATQHPLRSSVRAVINLEAAGTEGPELVFQATSEQMINAYAHVPRPHGTVLANDIFSSGIIMSDTDFRQFELYMNVTGLDMAIVGNSYFYHTRKDTVEHIEPGAAQHMAENAMALLKHLSSPESPLPSLTSGYKRPTTVFFSLAKTFYVKYSFETANALYATLFLSTLFLVSRRDGKTSALSHWRTLFKSVSSSSASFFGALFGANVVAFLMSSVFGRSLSWFRVEFSCLVLYAPAALAGALLFHILFSSNSTSERSLFTSTLLTHSFLACLIQSVFHIGSAVLFSLSALSLFTAITLESLLFEGASTTGSSTVWIGAYVIGQFIPAFIGTEIFVSVSDFFVPLTGRMGADAPAEHIISSMVAFTLSYAFPLTIPFIHRFGRSALKFALVLSMLTSLVMMALFAQREVFDAMHPKRVYVLHSENITTNEVALHIASSDGAPKFEQLAQTIASFVSNGTQAAVPVEMNPYNGDWDSLYPFSAFLAPYKVPLEPVQRPWTASNRFTVKTTHDKTSSQNLTRSLRLQVHHPGLIWTVIAFDAHVISWSLDDSPPPERARHHIKEASFYGEDTWSVDLVLDLRGDEQLAREGLKVNFVGIKETAMWPGKKGEKEKGGEAMKLFESLDGWIEREMQGTVDMTLLGCVGGVVVI